MPQLPTSLQKLINELSKLPGIGPKTAQRLAFYLLKQDSFDITSLSESITDVKKDIVFCSICHNMAEGSPCITCSDPKRDRTVICVVEEPLDAQALDKSGQYRGLFHVLGGVLNPLEGIGPDNLEIQSLLMRLKDNSEVRELVIATNPTLEGETTAMHLLKVIKAQFPEVKVTRIARGLPMGGDLEYADDITLMRALEGRREY